MNNIIQPGRYNDVKSIGVNMTGAFTRYNTADDYTHHRRGQIESFTGAQHSNNSNDQRALKRLRIIKLNTYH